MLEMIMMRVIYFLRLFSFSSKSKISPHKEHVSLRDLLIMLVVLVGKAEDLKCVVFVVREVEFHRHIGHLQR